MQRLLLIVAIAGTLGTLLAAAGTEYVQRGYPLPAFAEQIWASAKEAAAEEAIDRVSPEKHRQRLAEQAAKQSQANNGQDRL